MTDEITQPAASASAPAPATLTDKQKSRLDIFELVQNDTTAAKEAIDFIQEDPLKLELFKRQYALAQSEQTVLARTIKAVEQAKQSLNLFN